MKLNYRLIKISCILLAITLAVTSIFTFLCYQTKVITYFNNIFLNIFAGAFILLITSIVEYFVNRKKDLETFMKFIINYRNKFCKVEYLDEVNLLSYDDYKEKFNKDDSSIELKLQVENEWEEYNRRLIKNLDKIIDAYIDISKINFNDFLDVYNDFRFIFKNKKTTLKLYNDIFKYISDEVDLIINLSYDLNIYKSESINTIIIYNKIRKYQTHIFYEKKLKPWKQLDKKNMKLIKNGIPYLIVYKQDEGSLFIYNKMVKYLDDQFNNVGKIAYFNNKYKN